MGRGAVDDLLDIVGHLRPRGFCPFLGSWFGRLVLLGLTAALYYHLANGVRHLAWDIGWGYEMNNLNASGLAVVIFTGVMTVLTFLAGYWVAGAS